MKRKAISLLLAMVLCLGLTVPAFADSTEDLSEQYEVFEEKEKVTVTWASGWDYIVRYGLKDKAGNIVIPAKYSGIYLRKNIIVAGNGTHYDGIPESFQDPVYGVIDINENVLLPFEYENIYPLDNSEYFIVIKGGLRGIITDKMQTVIPPKYYEIKYLGEGYFAVSDTYNSEASPKFHMSYNDDKYGVCDPSGNLIVSIQYDDVAYLGGGYFMVQKGIYQGVVNSQNQAVIPIEYARVTAAYKDSFIVASYISTDEKTRENDRWVMDAIGHYGGRLIMTYSVVNTANQLLISESEGYADITVDDSGEFTCYVWNGQTKKAPSISGTNPLYDNVLEVSKRVNYSDLSVVGPAQNHVLEAPAPAVPAPAPTTPGIVSKFKDVASSSPFAAAVNWAVEKGITTGKTSTTFAPNENCTQAQILTFLWRANGSPEQWKGTAMISGISESEYYYKPLLWAAEQHMISGAFDPDAPCTRAEAMTYMWKQAGSPYDTTASFTDVPDGADYTRAVAWAVRNGITTGKTSTTFAPNEVCTRGQIMTFIYRSLA